MTPVRDWTSDILFGQHVRRVNVVYCFWANYSTEPDVRVVCWAGWSILHRQHVFHFLESLIVVIVLIFIFVAAMCFPFPAFMRFTHVPAVSGSYVTIISPLAHPKQFQLIDKLLQQRAALLARLFWKRHFCRSVHLDNISVSQWLYIRITILLMFRCMMTQSCDYVAVLTFNMAICLQTLRCCCEFLSSEKMGNGCKDFSQTLMSIFSQAIWSILYFMTQMFKNIFAISIELILAVWIVRVNFENMSDIIMTCWFLVVVFGAVIDINGYELKGLCHWEGLKLLIARRSRSILGAWTRVVYKFVQITRHERSIKMFLHLVVHTYPLGVSCQCGIVRKYKIQACNMAGQNVEGYYQ